MNYGIISSAIAGTEQKYRKCIDKFNQIGIPSERVIIASGTEEAINRLKPGDMLTVLYETHLYNRVSDVLQMMEQILACGIILCFYGECFSIIQPMELPELQELQRQISFRDEKKNSSQA